jgi:UDP-N-acetylglucosamine 4-epimerase
VSGSVGAAWKNFTLIEGDVADLSVARHAMQGVEIVLHQAALGSVKRSVEAPLPSHQSNVTGTLTLLCAARDAGVKRIVYASSSSVYGDSAASPKAEGDEGGVLSPYAATKVFCETYAQLFARLYGMETIGLRYFNVFGPRQNPDGEYAAVIPRWIAQALAGVPCEVYGDGKTSRDFCYIDNVVEANLRAAAAILPQYGVALNVALGDETTLLELHEQIAALTGTKAALVFKDFRVGDVRHSRANIAKAQALIGYRPGVKVSEGLRRTVEAMRVS